MAKRVFLGGTCNGSKWRDKFKAYCDANDVDYFDPVVEDWDEKAMAREIKERERCRFLLYTVTPKMSGVYSIAEVVEDAIKRPKKTILCILKEDGRESFTDGQMRSLRAVADLVRRNGAVAFGNLHDVIRYITDGVKLK